MHTILENASFATIREEIDAHEHFVLLSHVRPDGDAIGSQLGLAHGLQDLGKKVTLLTEEGVPPSLAFLPGAGMIQTPGKGDQAKIDAEVVFALDTATKPRLGERVNAAVVDVPLWINLDHHVSNPRYGHLNHIDSQAPATGQILYNFMSAAGIPINQAAAENLYAAISTDTGSFQFPSTTAETYRIGASLIEKGVRLGEINRCLYESFPFRRIELLRELLNALRVTKDGRVASWRLTQETVARLGLSTDDSEGLIDHIRAIEGVIVAVFFEELPTGKVRVSSRSKDERVDVGKVCSEFGGGGHKLAAGARMPGPIQEAEERFLNKVYDALEAID